MQQQQQQPENWNVSLAQSLALTYNIAYAVSIGVLPFIRHRFGRRAFDPHIVVTLFLLLLLSASYPVFFWYFFFWLFLVVYHRVKSWKAAQHSQYQGYPWAAMRIPFVKTEEKARHAEPLLCGFGALLVMEASPELALLFGAAGGALIVKAVMDELIDRRRLEGMRDAEIVMQHYADKFRERG